MKKKIQVMLFFLIMIVLVGIIGSNQVFAADEYSLSIEPISYAPQSNLMQRSVTVPSAVSDFENVQVDKYCYTGETFSLTAIIVPANAYVGKVDWTIEQNETIAQIVSQNGLTVSIKGVKAGTCKIVCTAADGQGAYTTCNLTVLQHAMYIELSPKELLLEPGDREQIIATIVPADTTDKTISWSSSNPEIAKVDKDGVVTGVSASLEPVTITCKVLDGSGVESVATVNVRVLVEVIEWQKFSNVIYKKGTNTEKFYTSVLPNHATIPTLKYTSSNPEIASLMADPNDNSCILITPKHAGKFNIICEATDGSKVKLVAEVEVIQLLEYVTLSESSKILFLKDGVTVTHQLQVKSALPADANVLNNGIDNAFTWSSSDSNIATVNQTGLVTALKPGTVTITATAKDLGAASASCTIYVRKPVTSMEIDLYSYEYIQDSGSMDVNLLEKLKYLNGVAYVYAGDTVALNAAFNDDATLKTVIWQIAGKGTDASGANILGIFAKVSDPYTNPTIMTALPINADNENGYLNVVITVKANDGSNVTAKRVVQIRQPATTLTINKTTMTLYTPDSGEGYATMEKLNVSILPENAYVNKNPDSFSDGSIIWISEDESVATVSSEGHVNAVGPGETVIKAKSADGYGEVVSCKVTVLQAIKNIEIYAYQDENKVEIEHQDSIYAYTNQEIRLFTNITPTTASNQKLTWNSGNPLIASVDDGYLKIGNKPTVTSESSSYITISCSATDGSGKTLMFYLYVLDSEYNIDVKDFLSITSGSSDKLLLKISKNDISSGTPISVPIKSDVTVSLSGNSVTAGNDSYEIIEFYDENGTQIKNSATLSDVTNPSFDIKARYNGVVTVKFGITPQDIASLPDDCTLIGKTISFERTCTINITGNDNRTISISQSSISMLVNEKKQINAVVLPATATNYYIKYGLKGYNDNYANPYEFARINEDTGIITGFEVGIVVVTATLYDSTTNKIVNTNGIDQIAEVPVYITESLTGVKMDDSFVYVGEEISLLDYVQFTPTALNKTLDKASAVRFNVVSGSEYIKFSANSFGHIQGINNGEVVIEAIATYGDATYTSNQAKITVKSRLNGISLVGSYGLKLNEMIKLNPTRNPSNGDLSQATITWTSSDTDYVTVTNNKDDGYNGLIGIVTARKATPSGNPVTVTLTVKTDKDTFVAKTEITVIPLDVDNFSADTTNKLYTLSTDGWQYYCYGAYALKSSGGHYAAGCLENGASSLSTVHLYNSGETSWYKGTYKYPSNYPLKTFVALERADALVEQAAAAAGITKQDLIDRIDAGLKLATAMMDDADPDAYLDLPNRSHLWVKNGNSYSYNSAGFVKWGHTSDTTINIFSGLLHSFDREASAEQVVSDLAGEFLTTSMNSNQTKLAGSYFTSALTSMNVLNGSPEVAKRQANAISIIGTYFPLDKMYQESGASTQYQKLHAARQMLIWSASGIKVDSTEYNRRKASNPDYVSVTENYAGSPLYYVCYMVQDNRTTVAANYMYYPHGYSAFYYAIKNILAPSRVTNYSTNIDKIMVIIEGFAWKLDQVKYRTIPSFASKDAEMAKLDANTIDMHYDASTKQYVATVCDTNGVLNYYTFSLVDPKNNKSLATFKNNGDGTLTISVPEGNVDRIIEIQENLQGKPEYKPASAAPELIPEDNLYECAAFAKWEMETEISQIPYTKANGSLGYVYMIGNNVQSQYIDVQNEMIKSNLGDPYEAYIAFSFDNPDTFDSVVESDVKIYDTDGNEVEYIIPNEQYQLKYIFTYTGHSRGLKVVDTNASLTARGTANVYGFAADMRSRGSKEGISASLLDLSTNPDQRDRLYVRTETSNTITTPIWALDADKIPVIIEGGYEIYDTGTGVKNEWNSGSAWNDNIYIDANVGDNQLFSNQEMVDSSQHPTHVTVRRTADGKVEITWVFYTAYTTFTTPYVNAYANITIEQDKTHPATKQLNQPNEDTDKYIYGLVIDGKRSVQGHPSSASVTINSYNDYISNYSFTGMVNTAKNVVSSDDVDSSDVVWSLFQDVNYKYGDKALSEYSLNELFNIGTNASGVGTIYFYQKSGSIVGIIVYIGSHGGKDFCVYWRSSNAGGTGQITGATWDNGVAAMSGCNLLGQRNYESYVHKTENGGDGEGDDNIGSTATHNPTSESMTTTFINSNQWAVPTNKLGDFTLTSAETYGGSGYLNAKFGYTYANNAQNYTTFHTDKTFQTVFDMSISDLVVNTGAGITSPTSVDTRNFVNLNIYYTINLDNSAYKVITNRWGKIGGVWWHYFKDTSETGQTDKAATKYEYILADFFYYDSNNKRVYCETDTNPATGAKYPEAGVTYYYDPKHTGDDSLPDKKSANGNIGDFIPDNRQHLVSGSGDYTKPAGWAEEKPLEITIHTDTFTNFYIYDNSNIPAIKKLDPAEFSILDSDEQWRILSNIAPTTGVYFIDNIQTGDNYIQHTVPYVLTAIESGVKIYGFSAHVNKTQNNGSGVVLPSGETTKIKNSMLEWGEKVGKYIGGETLPTKPIINHLGSNANMDVVHQSSSILGYKVSYLQANKSFSQPLKVDANLYKNYYYEAIYDWSYSNNDTATSMLQYPAYNPYTLSIVSTNGSLVYKNKANVTGFDITLGNNQNTHIPNTDNISYLMYLRKFGAEGVSNAVPINGTYSAYYYNGSESFINNGSVKTNNFIYGSLNFYKYSNTTYYVYNANGANTVPSSTVKVEGVSASTELVNETETESMKFTKILFKSTYTVSRNLGDKGWVDITNGNHPDAIVNAGKGFELKIEVTYTNNNLTDYLSRYLKDSAQLGKTGSAVSGVTSTGCNISPLTGEMGAKSMTDQYTAKVLENKVWNNVFGANLYEDVYVIMNNNNKYVYSYTGVYGSTQVFDLETTYNYDAASESGSVVMTYTMKLSPVNGFFGNTSDTTDKTGLATQNMKFYTDASAAGTVGSLTIWTNPIAATPFGYPGNMRDRYLADLAQIQYYIVQPVDNVDNIVQ